MRAGRVAAMACSCAILGSCVFPTERDASVHVSVTPIHLVFRGQDTTATAQAWHMVGPSDSQPIPNVVFVWSTSDPNVATVDNSGRIVGINSGTAIVTAAAANFDKGARSAADTVRVTAPLEIDSIRPKTVRYGEILTIYGVSVDSIISASLRGASLIRVPFNDTVFGDGTARSRWWVPPPARTDSLFFLGITGSNGVLGYVHGDSTIVIERDLYEPDDTVPQVINLDGPPPFPVFPTLVFTNPALAFEPVARGLGTDWYHFTQAETRDVTVILSASQVKGTFVTYLTDSLGWSGTIKNFFVGHDSWSFGPGSHVCHGADFKPGEAIGDSVIVAFKALPVGSLDMLAAYGVPGRYGLTVIAGYQSELPPDKHEDDNSCNAADARPLPFPFRDTLAIENPHDVDWLPFSVGALSTYQFRLHAFSGPSTKADSAKDLDLYIVRHPNPGDATVSIVSADTLAGSDVNRTVLLGAGSYYAVVVDFAGATTTYEICGASALGACSAGFPAPPVMPTAHQTRPLLRSPAVSGQP